MRSQNSEDYAAIDDAVSTSWQTTIYTAGRTRVIAIIVTFIALLVGLLTLYSMIKIWAEVFWKAPPDEEGDGAPKAVSQREMWLMATPVVGLALCTLFIGLNAEPLYNLAEASAGQLLAPERYIQAVLGTNGEEMP